MKPCKIAFLLLPAFFLLASLAPARPAESGKTEKEFLWPGAARCAVCLTYDDGIDGHLDIVALDLEAQGLRGTFFVPGHSGSLEARMDEWRSLAWRGHEIGNHSLFHPCIRVHPDGSVYEWLLPEYDTEKYTMHQMVEELRVMNTLLKALDGRKERTLAYPCAEFLAGGKSYVEEIRPLFTAARSYGEIPENMRDFDLYLVPSWSAKEVTGRQLIDYSENAETKGTLAVYMFHGVGGGHNLNVSREAHQELIAFLNANRQRFWTATFSEITHHIRAERQRLGWEH